MRYITEVNAKLIEEVLEQRIADLKTETPRACGWPIKYASHR